MLDIGIPEIPVVDAFAFLIGNVGACFRECFGDGAVRLQQMILKPAGDIEGREALGRITLDRADQIAGIPVCVTRFLQIAKISDFPDDVPLGFHPFHRVLVKMQCARKDGHFAKGFAISRLIGQWLTQ